MTEYRNGNCNARNIYRVVEDGVEIHVGVAFTEDDGRLFVEALNSYYRIMENNSDV